ncbi:hypothetical protein LVY72_22610 [Arthrobacter sp. I2-34]|uniref:Carboxypeptidase regulatory-like domain-containing protein n=1 Tax=Arthrobacter hankyongi TaxID=2904801 RepID=A0ABS9LDF0_9MICC|nr:hypothetical protein [Arthrobacter hankyongi]MCG2624686.1 hypothetical protein [Arthrobacter hankyongi]
MAIAVLTAAGGAVAAAPANAADTASMEGRVVDVSGKPIRNINVILSCSDIFAGAATNTDAQGRYSVITRSAEGCTLYFEDRNGITREDLEVPGGYTTERDPGTYAPRWYLNGDSKDTATVFTLPPYEVTRLSDTVLTSEGRKEFTETPTPALVGSPIVGGSLAVMSKPFTPYMDRWFYTWYRDGKPTRHWRSHFSTYMLTPADAGHAITVTVSGYAAGYVFATSEMSQPVSVPMLEFTSSPAPTIVGTATVGKWLGAEAGIWDPMPAEQSYQWYRSGVKISRATSRSYKLTGSDQGKTITVSVTGSGTGYIPITKTSAATVPVAKGTLVTTAPLIVGTKKVGHTLSKVRGSWTAGTEFKYQWYRSGKVIKSATRDTYKLTGLDSDKKITIAVTGTKAGYTTATRYSAAAQIAKGTLASKTPTISGTKKIGRTLTAKVGTWTSGTKFKYQWYRSGKAIKGADSRTYRLTTADRARSIKVRVTGSKTGYYTKTRYSASTSRIR